jgi:2-polyprenyl-6-methoxyphenol hydroxylase-like FAD-dependent oxidoreductase
LKIEEINMSIKQAEQVEWCGQHAAVIGASMAGLLVGRVLSDHFERVTIIERDYFSTRVEARKGVPQGRHVHGVLNKGASILTEFFPELFPALLAGGSSDADMVADVHWHHFGEWKAQFPSNTTVYIQSRPFLEEHVRGCLTARENVRFIDGCEVTRLCANGDHTSITGVQLRHRNGAQSEEALSADLVIDASGRGSQAPQWLTSLGYARVKEVSVKVDVGYASRVYRRPSQLPSDWKALLIYPRAPEGKRAGLILPIEGDAWMVTLAGWLRDYPPDDETGFLEYARSLPMPDLYEAIKNAEPLTPIATHKFPANRRRHYERMSRFPEGFIVVGDALCSFNPVYGQGMTVAALEASALQACLPQQLSPDTRRNAAGLAHRFQKAVAKVVNVPWLLATGEDFRYPETEGQRPAGMRLLNWYMGRVHELVASDRRATLRFYEVMNMLKPPLALFEPHILFAVLFKGGRQRSGHDAVVGQMEEEKREIEGAPR